MALAILAAGLFVLSGCFFICGALEKVAGAISQLKDRF